MWDKHQASVTFPSMMENDPNHSAPTVRVTPGGPVVGKIQPPGSKSLTNRALLCAAFAQGESNLTGCLASEDTEVMIESLRRCGVAINSSGGGRTLSVSGMSNRPHLDPATTADENPVELFIANSGTTVRFLTAALSAYGGNYRLSGVERMHARPIQDLVGALQPVQLGNVHAESTGGCPPVVIESTGWRDSPIRVAGRVSSQYLSGLMMAAPLSRRDGAPASTKIQVVGELVSLPYVEMTARVMSAFGANVDLMPATDDLSHIVNVQGRYDATNYVVEPDASAASYFWAAAAITGGEVTVQGLNFDALQGDVDFCRVLEQMGCRVHGDANSLTVSGRAARGVDVDMNAISDTVQTLAVVALFAEGPTRVRGVAHNRFKETDRIGDLACELRKMGATVDEHEDGLTIVPPGKGPQHAVLDTYGDHRMAMSLSLAGLVAKGIEVENPACTAKTYPQFFADLEQLLGRPHVWG
ncbi:MAG: 3-phosphoshikimate 1-carboxyvinyltransferase [Planctomycetota bacterium]